MKRSPLVGAISWGERRAQDVVAGTTSADGFGGRGYVLFLCRRGKGGGGVRVRVFVWFYMWSFRAATLRCFPPFRQDVEESRVDGDDGWCLPITAQAAYTYRKEYAFSSVRVCVRTWGHRASGWCGLCRWRAFVRRSLTQPTCG